MKVHLIEVPEVFRLTKFEDLVPFLIEKLTGYEIKTYSINFSSAYKNDLIEELSILAKSKSGKLISKQYLGNHTKLEWKCKEKSHPTWYATPANIKGAPARNGSWCPICSKQVAVDLQRFSIQDCKDWARKKGGVCLSNKYVRNSENLKWKCDAKAHKPWLASFANIRKGTWCPRCGIEKTAATTRQSIKVCHKLAKDRGGACLSKIYINSKTKLQWKCGVRSHKPWLASAEKVKIGRWCPACAIERRSRK